MTEKTELVKAYAKNLRDMLNLIEQSNNYTDNLASILESIVKIIPQLSQYSEVFKQGQSNIHRLTSILQDEVEHELSLWQELLSHETSFNDLIAEWLNKQSDHVASFERNDNGTYVWIDASFIGDGDFDAFLKEKEVI